MDEKPTPAPAWTPSPDVVAAANVTAVCRELGLPDYPALHAWSVARRDRWWELAIRRLGVPLRRPYGRILDAAEPTGPKWLVGARMNIVDACFAAPANAVAVVESDGTGPPRRTTYGQLRRQVERAAGALAAAGVGPGDAVGMVLPMSGTAVAAYLAVVAAGAAVVSIADSFAAEEIATRLRVVGARLVITQTAVARGGKRLPLYE
ncbi:MAG TPA: AMP-binding protein, partial [Isosphaeraceae bacterium]|nr:AMP-binding protein [Isosphaeraceae bacterium]